MALATVDYSSFFNNKLATKQITFTDSTDYVSQGTVAANVTIVAKVESPLGVFYNNTNHSLPDIDPGVSLDSIITIPLPVDAGGEIEQGLYSITLTYVDSVVPSTIIEARTFTLDYTSPTIDISMTVDCVTPQLAAIDNTAYTKGSIVPTITRAFSIHYPPSLALPDVTGTAGTLTTNTFYTVADQTIEHSSSLISNLSYLFNVTDSMYVVDEVTGADVIAVACDGDLCDIFCCIDTQYKRWQSNKNTNSVLAQKELDKFIQITAISNLLGTALHCGKSTKVSDYVTQILDIADCDAGCACADGTPQLVTGLGVSGDTVVVDEGTGVSIATVTGGGTTTYTVSLSQVNVNKLAATNNSIVLAGTNVTSVTSSSATAGDVTTITYTVNVDSMIEDSSYVRSLLTFSGGVIPIPTIISQKHYGANFQTVNQTGGTEFLLNNNNSSSANWTTNFSNFTVGNFFATPLTYFPSVEIVNIDRVSGERTSWIKDVDVEVVSMTTSSFVIRFVDKSGNPVNGLVFDSLYNSIELIFKIQA